MKDYETIENCLLCGEILDSHPETKQFVLYLGYTPLANEFSQYKDYIRDDTFKLNVVQCVHCQHIQLDTVVNPERLFRDYLYSSSTSVVNRDHFNSYSSRLIDKLNLTPNDMVIDLGSNDGLFLSFLKDKNIKVLGIDPAKNLAGEATKKGIPTIPEFFTSELAKQLLSKGYFFSDGSGSGIRLEGRAKVISANHIFAHLKEPSIILKGVLELLDTNGVFVFENSYLMDILDKGLFDVFYHEHTHTYSITTMVKYLRKFGMKIFAVDHLPNQQGGSFRAYCCRNSDDRPIDDTVFEFLEREKDLPVKLEAFKHKFEENKNAIWKLIKSYKDEGKVIDIFGYPAKLTTMLYGYGLTEKDTFRYAYDSAKLKQGKYSPGLHIEIRDPKWLMKDPPDILFVGGWNFADSIVEKCKEMGYKGKFVVPLPELKII